MGDTLLTANDQIEALSRVYVAAVAARAGYVSAHHEIDRDSVDVMLSAGGAMRPQIGIQLKATAAVPDTGTEFSFALPVKNYNDLRETTQSPRLLVVLALPADEKDWVVHSPEHIILKRCAYWKSLLGEPATTNTTTVTIKMQKAQQFDVDGLTALMDKSRKGIPL